MVHVEVDKVVRGWLRANLRKTVIVKRKEKQKKIPVQTWTRPRRIPHFQ